MEVDYQYQVDYAKSGRSGCNKCRINIAQNSFRIARLVQASNFDGKIPRWFHFHCFFTKNTKIKSTSEIKHFDSLRWEDQEKIRKAIGGATADSASVVKFSIKLSLPQFDCVQCKKEILKERHMIVDGNVESGICYHLSCFLRNDLCPSDISTLTGFKSMKKVDQEAILLAENEANKENRKRQTTSQANDVRAAKKAKVATEAKSDEAALKMQSKLLWKIRDDLEREVSKDALIGLLEYNEQYVPTGLSNLLEAVSDAMVFGALSICPSCQNGPLRYSNGQYKCSAMATEWAPCLYHTRDPARVPFRVPKEYHDVDFLRNYKYVARKRLFGSEYDATCKKALSDYTVFVTAGPHRDGKTKQQLLDEVKELGASVASKLKSGVLIVSSRDAWDTALGRLQTHAERLKLRVVSDDLIGALVGKATPTESKLAKLLGKYTISSWPVATAAKKSEENPTRQWKIAEKEGVMRVKLKNGALVDPECGLGRNASVMRDPRGNHMTAVLGMVDLVKGTNSFYRLQALEDDKKVAFWVFRAWGRIGTTIGGTKLEKFTTASEARQQFEDLYLEKTGNEWRNRANFEKKPHRFYEIELDYGDAEEKTQQLLQAQSIPSKLHPALQALIQFICDIESMKETMIEFELDLKKMPLGKLSKRQIQEAYTVLANLSKQLDRAARSKTAVDQTVLLGDSTQFYTLIPHDFGMRTPPLLDNRKTIKQKLQMLEDLREIELAYNLLRSGVRGDENPMDQHYRQLNTELRPMDPDCEEYARIQDYVRLTHGSTHNHYKLQVEAVFDVERADEKARFDKFSAAQHNKQLLWHGSRRTNWVGILSQGLRIAPPEAPVSGYMFGKGIYFADMVSKSANYCFTSHSQPNALLLLCEVILGDMDLSLTADSTPLPPGKHSRKGVGTLTPDPSTHYTNPDGVLYPIGKPIDANVDRSSLIYNEYIVYDVAQVKQKYLVRVKFLYN